MYRRTYLSTAISLWTVNGARLRDERLSSLPEIPDVTYWMLVARMTYGHTPVSRAETACLGDGINLGRATEREATNHLRLVAKGEFEIEEVVPKWWLELQRQLAGVKKDYREQRWSVEDATSDSTGEPSPL